MKKIVSCPVSVWAKKLFTVERYEQIAYFLDEHPNDESCIGGVPVYDYAHLAGEDKENLIVIVNDSRQYDKIATILSSYGLVENVHFFNGWKLDFNFYQVMYEDMNNWKNKEKEDSLTIAKNSDGWKKRAEAMAKLIPFDDVTSVMDLGCGEGFIEKLLPKNITYYGVDYCKRKASTIVCDLNAERIPDIKVDVYYMTGVLVYIKNVKKLFEQLTNAKYLIISNPRVEDFIRLDAKNASFLSEPGTEDNFTASLVTTLFEYGFVCKKMVWDYKERDEFYYLFQNIRDLQISEV